MTWKWAASPVVDQGYTELQTNSWDGTVGTSFPIFNRYEEIVFRVVTTPDTPNATPPGQSNPWAEVGGTF
jgi:hypothetical protein